MSNSKKMSLLEFGIGKIAVLKKNRLPLMAKSSCFFYKAILLPTTVSKGLKILYWHLKGGFCGFEKEVGKCIRNTFQLHGCTRGGILLH